MSFRFLQRNFLFTSLLTFRSDGNCSWQNIHQDAHRQQAQLVSRDSQNMLLLQICCYYYTHHHFLLSVILQICYYYNHHLNMFPAIKLIIHHHCQNFMQGISNLNIAHSSYAIFASTALYEICMNRKVLFDLLQ